ncbi:3'(2'),5'-bisphosphate nucleotidase 1-like [Culicoides brevitarsis]|uniref:3'(2'),5'-bisphosphate nucleotidase 1-like n=1 Tax=Culicoides brevitarsis TaxID=469753 RepID=UPI00307B64E7
MSLVQKPLVLQLLASSIKIAGHAGKIIRNVMEKGELGIVEKGVDDPQTEADRSSQRLILASLTKLFPKVKIIGEEGQSDLNVPKEWLITDVDEEFLASHECPAEFKDTKEDQIVVWVDPLDGTTEYTQGFLEHVTVLIGIAVNTRAVAGVIHQPYFKHSDNSVGRTIWGMKGVGIGGIATKQVPDNKLVVTTTRSHSNAIVQAALDAVNADEIIRVGGAGYKVLQLLEGKANAYVFASAGCKRWDTAAPEAILEAAGGILTNMKGEHYSYAADVHPVNKSGVLATTKEISHEKIVENIPKHVKEALSPQ